MTLDNSLSSCWIQHRQNLHNPLNFQKDGTAKLEYLTSGYAISNKHEWQNLSSVMPVSPLNFSEFKISSVKTTIRDSGSGTGSVVDEIALSWNSIAQAARSLSTTLEEDLPEPSSVSRRRRMDGSHIDAFFKVFLNGWSPTDFTSDIFTSINLFMILSADYENGKISNLRVFWNQTDLLTQLNVWATVDDMKPSPSMKQYILALPLRRTSSNFLGNYKLESINDTANNSENTSVPTQTVSNSGYISKTGANIFSTEKNEYFSSTKLNSKEVGGKACNIFAIESDPSSNIPFTKVNCKEVGGKSSNIFGPPIPTEQNKASNETYKAIEHPWESGTSQINAATGTTTSTIPSTHFKGSGFEDQALKTISGCGKKLDPKSNQSHIVMTCDEDVVTDEIMAARTGIHRNQKGQSQIQF